MRPLQTAMAALLAALAIQGCGDAQQDPASEAASPPALGDVDHCDPITRDDAAQLLGEPILEGERRRVGMTLCRYNPADPDSLGFLQVSINQPGGASYGLV